MEKSIRLYHWLPRIICLITIVLVSLVALKSYQADISIWQQIGSFAVVMIAPLTFLAFLIVAWRWELIGGIIFTIIGLMLSPYIFLHNYNTEISVWRSLFSIVVLILPFVTIGVLFIVSFFQKKKHHFFHPS